VVDIKRHKHIDGITLSGGDSFFQQEECVSLLKLLPEHLDVWIYTGFDYEEIKILSLRRWPIILSMENLNRIN
jgi:pyruvate-formate lyase-activating enzyme